MHLGFRRGFHREVEANHRLRRLVAATAAVVVLVAEAAVVVLAVEVEVVVLAVEVAVLAAAHPGGSNPSRRRRRQA